MVLKGDQAGSRTNWQNPWNFALGTRWRMPRAEKYLQNQNFVQLWNRIRFSMFTNSILIMVILHPSTFLRNEWRSAISFKYNIGLTDMWTDCRGDLSLNSSIHRYVKLLKCAMRSHSFHPFHLSKSFFAFPSSAILVNHFSERITKKKIQTMCI